MAHLIYIPEDVCHESEQRVVLDKRKKREKKDKVGIALEETYMTPLMTLTRDGDKLLLSGHTEFLDINNLIGIINKYSNKLSEEDINKLKKIVYKTSDKVSGNDIISRCDDWMKIFSKALAHLVKITEGSNYKPCVSLYYVENHRFDKNYVSRRGICLDIYDDEGNMVIKGLDISIPVENSNIYTYLVACVLEHCFNKHIQSTFYPSTLDLIETPTLESDSLFVSLGASPDDILTRSVIGQMYSINNSEDTKDPIRDLKEYLNDYRSLISNQRMNLEEFENEISFAEYDSEKVLSFNPSK
ncbi:MAG: hypothetical protein IKZ96_01940 [Bacilli bacterium]|nr:hypothetical protein [Bacilli bacterium]